jgi:hypothetical protein
MTTWKTEYIIEMDLRDTGSVDGWKMYGTISGSCPMRGFDISGVGP